ncbi:general secretion pathway protein GspK [Anaerohalosphaera lusitana]|nr:type II secretion system protein GspK [Anaerohalosphaera lusitana]
MKNRRAVILIGVLWAIALVTTIVVVVARSSMLDSRISLTSAENIRGHWACRAGLEKAIAVLAYDETSVDSFADLWYDNVEDFNDVPLDLCSFNVAVVDESSKLSLNSATKEQLIELPYMTDEIADSIIDWRDRDENVTGEGAETGYYLNLENGYEPPNGPFTTFDELLRVCGVTESLVYETARWDDMLTCWSQSGSSSDDTTEKIDVNRVGERQLRNRLSLAQAHARWIVENRDFDSIGNLLANNSPDEPQRNADRSEQPMPLDRQTFFSIIDQVTVSSNNNQQQGQAKVNINTAPRDVLVAVFEGDETLAEEVLSYREGAVEGFASLGDLAEIKSLTNRKIREFIDYLTVNSSVFRVTSEAVLDATGTTRSLTAIVDRSQTPVRILYYYEGPNR